MTPKSTEIICVLAGVALVAGFYYYSTKSVTPQQATTGGGNAGRGKFTQNSPLTQATPNLQMGRNTAGATLQAGFLGNLQISGLFTGSVIFGDGIPDY